MAATIKAISPGRLAEIQENGPVTLIDVRTPVEFREVHVPFARNVPLDWLDPSVIGPDPVYVICRSGRRGQKACDQLAKAGLVEVTNVEGGTLAWEAAGLTVVRGKKMMSLERQVQIAAGALVLLGVGLGFTVHDGFFGLAAFVGTGLVFAGITDTCRMRMVLARMPLNRSGGASCTA